MASDPTQPVRLDYAEPAYRPVSNALWALWLAALLALPAAGYAVYVAAGMSADPPAFLGAHRLAAGVAGGAVAVGALWFLRYVLMLATNNKKQLDAIADRIPGDASKIIMCRKCGPFPAEQLVVIPATGIWAKRVIGVVFLAGAAVIVTLYLRNRIGAVWHTLAVLCVIVGMNLWRLSRQSSEKCPRCGSAEVVGGKTDVGKVMYQRWKASSGRADTE